MGCDAYMATPLLGSADHIELNKGVDTIHLHNPILGDSKTIDGGAIIRHTKANWLRVYRDSEWPMFTSLAFTFARMKESEMDDFRTFVLDYRGQEIKLKDHEDRDWEGFIFDDEITITRRSALGCELFDWSFTFRGDLA